MGDDRMRGVEAHGLVLAMAEGSDLMLPDVCLVMRNNGLRGGRMEWLAVWIKRRRHEGGQSIRKETQGDHAE